MKTFAIAAAALGLVSATATPVLAEPLEKMSIEVNVSDINLASVSGQKLLDQRIERAVRTVCRTDAPTTGSRILSQEKRECVTKARADAREQVALLTGDRQRGG